MERLLRSEEDKRCLENLEKVAALLDPLSKNNIIFRVEDCYMDVSQDWKWTTIIAHDIDIDSSSFLSSWQAITNKEWKEITEATTDSQLLDIVKSIIERSTYINLCK